MMFTEILKGKCVILYGLENDELQPESFVFVYIGFSARRCPRW